MLSYYLVYAGKAGSTPPRGIIVLETRSGDALIWNHQSKAWQYDPQTAQRFVFDDQNLERLEVVDRGTAQRVAIQVTGREPLPDEDTIAWSFRRRCSPPRDAAGAADGRAGVSLTKNRAVAVIPVRTLAEAGEYVFLQLLECGEQLTVEPVGSYQDGDRWVDCYVAGCAERGVRREFEFAVEPSPPDPEEGLFGPGPAPSRLIDAGGWYLVLARYLQAAGDGEKQFDEAPSLALAEEVHEYHVKAVAAISEILKFIPPGDAAPPDSAYWTDNGRLVRQAAGEQLTRSYLERAHARFAGVVSDVRDACEAGQAGQ